MTRHAKLEAVNPNSPVLSMDKDGILCEYYPTKWITAAHMRQALQQRAVLSSGYKRPLLITFTQRINFADDIYNISPDEFLKHVSVIAFALKGDNEDNQINRMSITRFLMQANWPIPAHVFFDEATALLWLRLYT